MDTTTTPNADTETAGSTTSRRRFLTATLTGVVVGASGCTSARGQSTTDASGGGPVPQGPTIGLETVADGFEEPTDFAVPSGSNRRFVVERVGQVFVLGSDGQREEPFLDVSGRMTPVEGEQGLLGIAFHPDFQSNGRFYLRYSAPSTAETPETHSHTAVLSEFRTSEDGSTGRLDSERRLLEVPEPQSNHNAGAVTFGPDGYLYVPFGDGGAANDAGTGHASDWYEANDGGNGQNVTENFLGSMLRIDVDSRENGKPYGIPDDNPLVGRPGLPEQFAWGFRNPWRMGFSNGQLFVADVGQDGYEEVNIVQRGGNYGWNVREGTHCFSPNGNTSCPDSTPSDVRGGEPLRDPVIEYPHTRNGQPIGVSVIGGYIYEGSVDVLGGQYVFGDYSDGDGTPTGSLFAATPAAEGLWSFEKLDIAGTDNGELNANLLAIGRDNAGELYALTTGGERGGGVHRLVPASDASGSGATGATQAGAGGNETDAGGGAAGDNGTGTESGATGPGFGALAALAGLTAVGARLLGRE